MKIFHELKRRNVFRVGIAYVVGAWVMLQIVDFVLDAISAPNWIVQVFILAAAVGLPVVLIVSWVFELTPEGLKRESEIDRTQPLAAQPGHKLDRAIIAFLVVAVLILVGERFLVRPVAEQTPAKEQSALTNAEVSADTIAVLPFVNMSSDAEQEYFSDGITEEILNRLAGIQGLQVAARTSVFSFKGQNQDIREIARKLGVGTVLEGSVRRAGDEIRITAQLIRASDGFHLWSQTYDRKLENVFAIQDDIAGRIAEALQVSMSAADQAAAPSRSVDPEVYDLYLRARAMHRQRGEVLLEAIELFERALEIDPDFAPAWAGLSHSYIVIPNYISEADQNRLGDILGKSLAAAERALELDPNLPSAIHALANNRFFRFEWAEAERLYLEALALDPDSADIMEDLVSVLTATGQLDAARPVADRMIELDPYVPVFHNAMVGVLLAQGEKELADQRIRTALEINPDLPNIQLIKLSTLLIEERYEEARRFSGGMSNIHYSPEEFLRLIDWLESGAETPPDEELMRTLLGNPAFPYLAGDYEIWLESVRAVGERWSEWYLSPLYDLYSPIGDAEKNSRFRSDPRTKAYMESLQLPEYWRQVGWPDICRPVDEVDFACS